MRRRRCRSATFAAGAAVVSALCLASPADAGVASAAPAARTVVYDVGVVGTFGKVASLEHRRPTPVPGITGTVVQVVATNSDSYALTSDGTVWVWGVGSSGQLGDGRRPATSSRPVKVQFPAGTRIAFLSDPMPYDGGLAVDRQGRAWGWGANAAHDLCLPGAAPRLRPVELPLSGVRLASGAGLHSLFESRGTVYACGDNSAGELGDGTTTGRAAPTPVTGLPHRPVKALTSSYQGSGALLRDGTYYDWGLDDHGQLGDGTTTDSDVPVQVALPGPATRVSQGGSFGNNGQTLAILADRSLWAWGSGQWGQLGVGDNQDSPVPVRVSLPPGVRAVQVSAGGYSCYAVDAAGRLWAWGQDRWGQLGTGNGRADRLRPVAVGITLTQVSSTATNVVGFRRR